MPPSITDSRLVDILKAVEATGSSYKAAGVIGLTASTIRDHMREADRRGLTSSSQPTGSADPIEIRRLRDQLARAVLARRIAERAALHDKSLREAVFGLAATPLSPPDWNPPTKNKNKTGEAAILMLSDFHFGEVIDLAQMGGVNSFNQKIARARIERLFKTTVELLTKHWTGQPPSVLYVPLLGDLISGEIHDELTRTNDLLSCPSAKSVTECLIAGFNLLLREIPDIPIEIISFAGNHARETKKPESKDFAINSYDTLVAWWIESWFSAKEERRIRVSAPASGEAVLDILGWKIHMSHGDRIGARGSTAFAGPANTISRGFQKVQMDYSAQCKPIDIILIGHFHTAMELPQGFANGCLPGPSQFSRTNRMRPEPASQWLLTIHKRHGVARRWRIGVGHPSEGSIYKGRE